MTDSYPKRAKIEKEFEKARQEQFQNLPSRFNCLWVAENSENGEEIINKMFPQKEDRKSFVVEILPESIIHKADKRWYEIFYQDEKREYLLNYWLGKPFNEEARWEFLIDGGFKISKEDILFLRKIVREKHGERLGKDLIERLYQINSI